MSIHLDTPAYSCKNCKTIFMAYSKGLACPKCGHPEESQGEGYNFVGDQVGAMMYHKHRYKQFTPHGWYTGSKCDQFQWLIFRRFDYAIAHSELGWSELIKDIAMVDGDGKEFTNDKYFQDLFLAIDEKLKISLEEARIQEEHEAKEKEAKRLVNRIKAFFKSRKLTQ